ncbi:hypothetical protein [Klebsiella oxytoca]|uniref:DNA polymerase V n=1 Tax=Klebsiella oxytoca TaxID=571 RepID=A0AAD3UP77_KLEOX|nr:hypothetical protein [Klebsiella oxytoca]MEC6026349.1 hypothetical protein [Klebsiella oxytoca]HAU4359320.1 hypothetical protein [Klebsiella oxytoca]HAU4364769.1 hypothetical protein [Klebsiella oxytoca]HAU4376149.1 hypothetical protein [Klebsiella oxytoca]
MGFPSPATDYVESTLTVSSLCNIGANSRVISTDSGFAVLDLSLKAKQGSIVLIRHAGFMEFAKILGRAFITMEGEAIEGEALDDVEVIGVVTYTIHDASHDDRPV